MCIRDYYGLQIFVMSYLKMKEKKEGISLRQVYFVLSRKETNVNE